MTNRPRTRGDCKDGERPCPFASCRYQMQADPVGSGRLWVHGREFFEMEETCALDVADRGSHSLEQVSGMFGISRERIRQLEVRALTKLVAHTELLQYLESVPGIEHAHRSILQQRYEVPDYWSDRALLTAPHSGWGRGG